MREESRLLDYLEHILQAIGRIQDYTEDLDEVAFLKEEITGRRNPQPRGDRRGKPQH